jgi:AhpD family alkylhydroperoxidase
MQRITFQQIPEQLMSCMMQTENYLNSVNIEYKLLELMRFYVSQLNECAYCIDMHFKEAIAAGETVQRLYSVSMWQDTNYYNEREQTMLAWAASVTQLSDKPLAQQPLFDELKQHFSLEEIANLTLAVTQINSWNRLAKSFGFEAGSYKVGQH